MIECDKYTISGKEKSRLYIHSRYPLKSLVVKAPDAALTELSVDKVSEYLYTASFVPSAQKEFIRSRPQPQTGKLQKRVFMYAIPGHGT